jgi:class 3 adenylate cyclase
VTTVKTANVKYVFLDIVGFTKDRSVEAQSDLVLMLNKVVHSSLQQLKILTDSTILLPTGDGICICLVEIPDYDIHLRLALEILRLVEQSNQATVDQMRQFSVRIGINENVDNLVLDANDRQNVAGSGISMAQRIMDKADGSQILVGQSVHGTLGVRERYMKSFRRFDATAKHGVQLVLFQYRDPELTALNSNTPTVFVPPKKVEQLKLSKLAAYYIAHASVNRDFLFSRSDDVVRDYAGTVLLYFLSEDSAKKSETPAHERPMLSTWRADKASFPEQYEYYKAIEIHILMELADLLASKHLAPYANYFELGSYLPSYALIMEAAVEKLRSEWPQIAAEFGLAKVSEG